MKLSILDRNKLVADALDKSIDFIYSDTPQLFHPGCSISLFKSNHIA